MNKILNFLQDASDLYITFTESQICLDLRNKSIIKLESIKTLHPPKVKMYCMKCFIPGQKTPLLPLYMAHFPIKC